MVKTKVNELCALLTKSVGNEIEIVRETTTLLTAPGEHYGSIMLALEVLLRQNEKEKVYNLVAKLIPANEMLRLAFDIYVTFKKEVIAYTITIPALTQLQKEYKVKEEHHYDKLFPKCFGARLSLKQETVDEDAILLFENLKLQGYKTEDRLSGFDYNAAVVVLKDLARFHAVPIAMKILKPEEFENKVRPCLVKNKGLEQLPAEVGLAFHNSIMEGARELPELQPYLKRIQEITDNALLNPYVERPPPKEPWGSVSHSDFWVSNTMLLRNEKGSPIQNKIVDLQIMTYSSIVRDLLFFIFTSIKNEDLDVHYDDLLQTYYESFVLSLKELQVDTTVFNFNSFLKEIEEVAPSELYHILVMLKPICTERGKVENSLEDFQDSDWSRKDLLGPSHRRKLRDTVLALVKRNWI